jgi:anti-anti-sigma factor
MELTVSHEEGYVIAEITGPLDDEAGDLFREYLHPLVGQRGTKIVLDLSKANRVNSCGLGHLVSLVVHANTKTSTVVLAACSPFVSGVLARSKLERFFEMVNTVSEAVSRVLDGP